MKTDIILSCDTLEKLKKLFSDVNSSEKENDMFSAYIGKLLNPAKDSG